MLILLFSTLVAAQEQYPHNNGNLLNPANAGHMVGVFLLSLGLLGIGVAFIGLLLRQHLRRRKPSTPA